MSTDVVNNEPVGNEIRRLFAAEARYFEYTNTGAITQADLAPDRAHEALTANLKSAGLDDLPYPKITLGPEWPVQGYQRSDNVVCFRGKDKYGATRSFNFYTTNGPENIAASFSLLDSSTGETTEGMRTKDGKWLFRVQNGEDITYYQAQKQKRSY